MRIVRTSPFSNKLNGRDIDITYDQLDRWEAGQGNIQDIMPDISADDREFIMTGITPEEWAETFREDMDDEEDEEDWEGGAHPF